MNENKPNAKRSSKPRRNRTGKRTPFRAPDRTQMALPATSSPSQVADMRRLGNESKTGQFAEQLQAGNKEIKRERLHKVLAQSGHGSRRDMEILIASGRVLVNGNVASAGVQVGPGDVVLVDHRHVKLSFAPEFPRVLLYHKPEGEIVTTSDPGNRITVFDNLPRVENGKWLAIGRLDFNTSGLLIFTTSGELANRMTHPRFEIEREYAVRILGQLTEEQTRRLLEGIDIDGADAKVKANGNDDDDDDGDDDAYADAYDDEDGSELFRDHELDQERHHNGELAHDADAGSDESAKGKGNALARFASIEPRGGEGVNHWYHIIIKEGRNREVRRMFEALGLTVSRLMRVRFGKIELPPRLLRGKMLELDPAQVKDLLLWAGVPMEGMEQPHVAQKPGGAHREREREREGQRRQPRPGGHGKQGKQGKHAGQANQAGRPPRGGPQIKPAVDEGNKTATGQRRHRSRRPRPPRPQES
jgi:16S rRNA U516 pseudouridylate synthase RsuA-like enzyme